MTGQARSVLVGVCLMASACAFAASPEDPQSGPTSKFPSQPVSLFEEKPINWKSIVPDVFHDQQTIWTFPAELAHVKHWKPALGITVALGALVALGAHDTPYFRNIGLFGIQPWFERNECGNRHRTRPGLLLCLGIGAQGFVRDPRFATGRRIP